MKFLALGGLLTVAAVLSIASAVRLALDLHATRSISCGAWARPRRRFGRPSGCTRRPRDWWEGPFPLLLLYATYRTALRLLYRADRAQLGDSPLPLVDRAAAGVGDAQVRDSLLIEGVGSFAASIFSSAEASASGFLVSSDPEASARYSRSRETAFALPEQAVETR